MPYHTNEQLKTYTEDKRNLKISSKEPNYLYTHHDQARLKLGIQHSSNDGPIFYSTSNSIKFNNSIISRSFYLLMTFIALLIVLSALVFGIREYQLSFKRKIKSRQEESCKLESNSSNIDDEKINSSWKSPVKFDANVGLRKEDEVQSLENVIQACGEVENLKSGTGLTKFLDNGGINGGGGITLNNVKNYNKLGTSNWKFPKYKLSSKAMSVNVTTNSNSNQQGSGKTSKVSGISDKSISKYGRKQQSKFIKQQQQQQHRRYSVEELLKMNGTHSNTIDFQQLMSSGMQKIQISQLINCSIRIPKLRFLNAWQACTKISEIKTILFDSSNDKILKILAILQLISFGKHDFVFDNPNIFLSNFNEFIENLIDSCIIFELFTICNNWLQSLIIEFFLMYFWSHAKYKEMDLKCKIISQQFLNWNLYKPTIQDKFLIFRMLCNLYLGIKSLNSITILKENEIKLSIVIRDFIKHSLCNDYIQILPMLIKAIDVSNSQEKLKLFFYEMIKILIQKHKHCCMNEYLHDINNYELKKIIQYGLQQYPQSNQIYKKANDIYKLIIDDNHNNRQTNSGNTSKHWYFTSSINDHIENENQLIAEAIPLSTEYVERFFTPDKKINSTQSKQDEISDNLLKQIDNENIDENFEDSKSGEFEEFTSWQIGYLSNKP
ncbi:uncharacterized protein KGF55_002799 [Candida pseudojiufengensis]|uniref:uncharacterized protein n=1 Tax=Candida pseudojiufengensis TaxID=497109 RepID=UPI0022250A26|nr:uncharacterized protein KGF55_002799 [Candida pseudojiufengensis]KAI5963007.1 hypothetical protein KGF55_002799 [Candida pseudojiufengensis]